MMNIPPSLSTHEKTLQVNLDKKQYGVFTEVGAGQEVVRWFFKVGGASGTVAKSMSAYDMAVSDSIYGKSSRYVSRDRLKKMLNYEYELLVQRLGEKRGKDSTFFVFANTVVARNYKGVGQWHGWMGIRFQKTPESEPSEIIIHVRLWDKENLQQQEALGIMGVNLIHGAFNLNKSPRDFISSLLDGLSVERVEVDMMKFSGVGFEMVDSRIVSLELVSNGLTNSVMFSPDGEVVQPSEILYNRPIVIERGRFRPVTRVNLDIMDAAHEKFSSLKGNQDEDVIEIMELTINNLISGTSGEIDCEDFLSRADIIASLGRTVMISNYAEFHRLGTHLHTYTSKPIVIALGIPILKEIFNEKYYADLQGGILESFGRLFKNNIKLYAYPALKKGSSEDILTTENLDVPKELFHLYQHFLQNKMIEPLEVRDKKYLGIASREISDEIAIKGSGWEEFVVPEVAEIIKKNRYFNYKG